MLLLYYREWRLKLLDHRKCQFRWKTGYDFTHSDEYLSRELFFELFWIYCVATRTRFAEMVFINSDRCVSESLFSLTTVMQLFVGKCWKTLSLSNCSTIFLSLPNNREIRKTTRIIAGFARRCLLYQTKPVQKIHSSLMCDECSIVYVQCSTYWRSIPTKAKRIIIWSEERKGKRWKF